MVHFKQYKKEMCDKDEEFRKVWEETEPARALGRSLAIARVERNVTQKELSALSGVCQADISRIESAEGNPSLKTLQKIAKGLGAKLRVEFVIEKEDQEDHTNSEF